MLMARPRRLRSAASAAGLSSCYSVRLSAHRPKTRMDIALLFDIHDKVAGRGGPVSKLTLSPRCGPTFSVLACYICA